MNVYSRTSSVMQNYIRATKCTENFGSKILALKQHKNTNTVFGRALNSSSILKSDKTPLGKENAPYYTLNKRKPKLMNEKLVISKEVQSAVAGGKPVVALESAIITHGMPSPHNLITALQLEEIIRNKGCTPATVGVIRGRLTVGLSASQLYLLADSGVNKHKISTRDLPFAATKQLNGGTTVSATLLACRLAGIDVFVTGGIGGVHRAASPGETTWDVSADLVELGHSSGVAVVCSGIKSILDIPASLEYLETQGVSTTVLDPNLPAQVDPSQKVYFPDFFTRSSGVTATSFLSDPTDAARMILNVKRLRLRQGLLFAVPIPQAEEPSGAKIKKAIEEAVALAYTQSVSGRDVTPFVLAEVLRATGGRSLAANSALIRQNAAVGAQVASALSELRESNVGDHFYSSLELGGVRPSTAPSTPAQEIPEEQQASPLPNPEVGN